MGELHENCGVAAVSTNPDSKHAQSVVYVLYKLLLNMQTRGQLSAGVTTYNPKRTQLIDTYKNLGTVNEVFKTSYPILSVKIFRKYAGTRGIGHTRYATCGDDDRSSAQPFERHHGRKWKWFSFCFNGNIANYAELKKNLLKKADYHMIYDNDTEIMMHYLSRQLQRKTKPDLKEVFQYVTSKFDGAYNIAFMNAFGDIAVVRDPLGFKPMCYGYKDDMLIAASETNALYNIGAQHIKFLQPGQIINVHNGNVEVAQLVKSPRKAHCMFEWVYFANVGSVLDNKSVYAARTNLGKSLAEIESEDVNDEDYVVVAVPDSAKPAGDGYAYELGLPNREGLVRNRFVGRTFIESGDRSNKVRNKFTVLKEVVEGKKVLLVDDSVVRGTTTQNIVRFIKDVGKAKEVHVRVSCPPIMAPCFYGIDMSTISELFAPKYQKEVGVDELPEKVQQKMAQTIGADSLVYQTIPSLIKSIGIPKGDLCMACLNGDYPTPCGKMLYGKAIKDNKLNIYSKRTYE